MSAHLWKKIDVVESPPCWLTENDNCYYARDYISGGGYSASESNQLIMNFKKPQSKKETMEWPHKITAVKQFAQELSLVLPDGATIVGIPSSKSIDDPDYDPRLDWTMQLLTRMSNGYKTEYPIIRETTTKAVHDGARRNPEHIYATLKWNGFKSVPTVVFLIDDVITSGAHFKACQRLIYEYRPDIMVLGLFWARTVWPDRQ